jgi:N-methylhydantoinase A
LNKKAAEESLARLGSSLGMTAVEAAAGAVKIADFKMANLIRRCSVERGYDPRDFVLYVYGGAGPCHAGVFAREAGVECAVVPLGGLSSAWSALGVASSGVMHVYEESLLRIAPFDPDDFNDRYDALEAKARDQLRREGVSDENVSISRSADMKFGLQVHVIETPVPEGRLDGIKLQQLCAGFVELYESRNGRGTGFTAAGFQCLAFRVKGIGRISEFSLSREEPTPGEDAPQGAIASSREVYWPDANAFIVTPIYLGERLRPGNKVRGPAIIELGITTAVVHPGQNCNVDSFGNLVLRFTQSSSTANREGKSCNNESLGTE